MTLVLPIDGIIAELERMDQCLRNRAEVRLMLDFAILSADASNYGNCIPALQTVDYYYLLCVSNKTIRLCDRFLLRRIVC